MQRAVTYIPKHLADNMGIPRDIQGYVIARHSKDPEHGTKEYLRVNQYDGQIVWVGDLAGASMVGVMGGFMADCIAHFFGGGAVSMAVQLPKATDSGEDFL